MTVTGKLQPKQEVNAEPEDKLTTIRVDKEKHGYCYLDNSMVNALNTTSSELQTTTVHKIRGRSREHIFIETKQIFQTEKHNI